MSQSNSQGQKQHTPEFENCIESVMKQGHKKGSAFAICTTTFEKAQKPIFVGESESQKLHLFSESIKVEGHRVSGIAIHPKRIFHPEEGVEHVYLRGELENAAPTLIGKPFGVDHMYVLPPPNVITNAWYDAAEDGVAFEGTVDEQIAEQIQNKAFKGLSIELNWLRPGGRVEFANGVMPRNFELTSVHLLRNFPPGDKDAYIKFWNAIMEQLVLGPPRTIDDRVHDLEEGMRGMRNMLEVINGKIDVLGRTLSLPAVSSSSATPKLQVVIPIGENATHMQEAEWDTAYVNDLPDNAFAVIDKSGEKDEQGKTTPRSLRHLPHHNKEGAADQAHVAAALQALKGARTGQIPAYADEAKVHLCSHAKELGMASEVCGLESKQGESEELKTLRVKLTETERKLTEALGKITELEGKLHDHQSLAGIVQLRKDLVEAQAKVADLSKDLAKIKEKFARFVEAVKGTHPILGVQRSWSLGPQKMIAEQLRILREFAPEPPVQSRVVTVSTKDELGKAKKLEEK